jgi:hypothetical protein
MQVAKALRRRGSGWQYCCISRVVSESMRPTTSHFVASWPPNSHGRLLVCPCNKCLSSCFISSTRAMRQGGTRPVRSLPFRAAWNINIRSPCWITNPTSGVSRGRDDISAASLTAWCDISILMSRNWPALMRSQCWSCDARGCNCSGKNQL